MIFSSTSLSPLYFNLFTFLLFFFFFVVLTSRPAEANDLIPASISNSNSYHNLITNLSTSVGKTVHLNCSLNSMREPIDLTFLRLKSSTRPDPFGQLKLNPTWLKADVFYEQNGFISGYKTENIIVTRKGIISDLHRDKMKLISLNNNDKTQILKINEVDIKDEGKYICREFNSQSDKLFYLNVFCKFMNFS